MPSDCTKCKNPCGYPESDWYPIGVIRFCRTHMLWLLENIEVIRDGRWVRQPGETGYIDPGVRSQPRQTASFERAAQIAAEVDSRIKKCGIEGKLLEYEVQDKRTFSESSYKALNYVSGWRRRRENYRQFKSRKNRRS